MREEIEKSRDSLRRYMAETLYLANTTQTRKGLEIVIHDHLASLVQEGVLKRTPRIVVEQRDSRTISIRVADEVDPATEEVLRQLELL